MDYLDFELCVGKGEGRRYPLSVVRSPAGETKGTLSFPLDEVELRDRLQTLQIALLKSGSTRRDLAPPEEHASVEAFGRTLFGALLPDEIRSSYRLSRQKAKLEGKGLRLRLRIEAPDLAALPWEFLYDDAEGDFVCLSSDTPVVRYLELDRAPEVIAIEPPLRVLGMIASPGDRAVLDVTRERARMAEALSDLEARGRLAVTWLEGQTWRDLQRAMRQGPWHVFHFVGHGGFDAASGEGLIALANDDGSTMRLPATQLGRLLADHRSLRLAVLNACEGAQANDTDLFSSTASVLIRRGIPAVVAMQYEITDEAAIEFSHEFYEALGEGLPVDAAVAEARKAISLAATNTVEWGTPVLHMRSPDGRLFALDAPPVVPATPPPPRPDPSPPPSPMPWTGRKGLLVGVASAAALALLALGMWLRPGPGPVPPTPAPTPPGPPPVPPPPPGPSDPRLVAWVDSVRLELRGLDREADDRVRRGDDAEDAVRRLAAEASPRMRAQILSEMRDANGFLAPDERALTRLPSGANEGTGSSVRGQWLKAQRTVQDRHLAAGQRLTALQGVQRDWASRVRPPDPQPIPAVGPPLTLSDCRVSPLETRIASDPVRVEVGKEVWIEATVDGHRAVEVDFGDGTPLASTLPTEHAYTNAGLFTLTITATDGTVSTSCDIEVEVTPPVTMMPAPLSDCRAAPSRVQIGQTVTFSSATPGLVDVDLGDGTLDQSTFPVRHQYNQAGPYTARFFVGGASCEVDVSVVDAWDPGCAEVTELNPVTFAFRSSVLTADARSRLDENIGYLLRFPEMTVRLDAYADSEEGDGDSLSQSRADAVRAYYVASGVERQRVKAVGRGTNPTSQPKEDPGPGDARARVAESIPRCGM